MKVRLYLSLLLIFLPLFALLSAQPQERWVNLVTIDGPIGPVSARIIIKAIDKSVMDSAEALVIELDTPGGLDEPMRDIITKILNSSVPVIVYISPAGSRAASAGAFITLSAHIAAMAPGTNIGAAHPVFPGAQVDSVMKEKATHDAAAYIKSIANKRGRNVEWAEKAVRESVSETEYDAFKLKVIDLVANNLRVLLDECDGRKVPLPSGEKVLRTEGRSACAIESWKSSPIPILPICFML